MFSSRTARISTDFAPTFDGCSRLGQGLEKDRDIAIMMWVSWMKSEKVIKVTIVRSLDRFLS